MGRTLFYVAIIFLVVITVNLWIVSLTDYSVIYQQPYRAFSRIFALIGLVLFALSLLLSSRISFIEDFIGGLDAVYTAHHILGSLAFVLLINHPVLLAIQSLPFFSQATTYFIPVGGIAEICGVLGIYAMLFSFVFMLFIKLSYQYWLYTHRFLFLAFVFSAFHIVLISSDISNNTLLRWWILAFTLVGLVSGFYMVFLYARLGPQYQYIVKLITIQGDTADLLLTPVKRHLQYLPGQFVYLRFYHPSLRGEKHPFTIASISEEEELRLVIKMAGDYTKKLGKLSIGAPVSLYGPYGRFGSVYLHTNADMVWIAGGIGITPFLSMLHHEAVYPSKRHIYFVYSYRIGNDPFLDEIKKTVSFTQNVTFIPWSSEQLGRLNVTSLQQHTKRNFKDSCVLICGPLPMMISLRDQFEDSGLNEQQIIFENFSMT